MLYLQATDASDAGGLTHVDATARRLAALRHRHLLPLVGSCPDLPMLVYDLGPREEADFTVPLADIMQPPPAGFPATQLGWQARVKVCADVAAAIIFLQERTPPVFCGVPLDVGRVVVDMGTGDARLGFVGLGAFTSSGPVALGHEASPPPDVTSAREMEDVRALGVLLLRLLLGNVSGDADELVGWVRGVMQYERGDGGVGQALAGLALAGAARGGGGIEWPPEVTLFFAEMALRCASCSLQGGVPNLRFEVLPHLHQLRNHQRLPIAGACQPAILHSPHGQGGQAIQGQPQQAPTPQGRCWGD
ncbi:hypothetical protein HXX76_008329 [Chlamydomonas incerta]|uniref:Protein kinase domain-containing protein n=1 Tax=Chlamydomonas incerta TaxID=51695 RepID=A0A835SWW9_CHLIN|nr:hypothetical protein HXX76_008329 [Chlamydomonas incerta]|eukprot:KAG2433261.1 hypothetical protein HXX76_008329 [Chlamydomonas incerta]